MFFNIFNIITYNIVTFFTFEKTFIIILKYAGFLSLNTCTYNYKNKLK